MQLRALAICVLLSVVGMGTAMQWCEKDMYQAELHTPSEELEALVIWFPVRAGTHNVLQLCSNLTGQPVERHCSYDRNSKNATWQVINKETKLINCSAIVNQCNEEPFQHQYQFKNRVRRTHENKWQAGRVGELVPLQDPCLLSDGLPLTRECIFQSYNFMALWEPIDNDKFKNVVCLHDVNQKLITRDLNKLYLQLKYSWADFNNEDEQLQAARTIAEQLTKSGMLRISADLGLSSNILEIITENNTSPQMLPEVVEISNLLMKSDEAVVDKANELEAPKKIVKNLEKYFDSIAYKLIPTEQCDSIDRGVKFFCRNMTSLFVMNPLCSNVSGIAIYRSSIIEAANRPKSIMYDTHTNTFIRYLYMNQSLEELLAQPDLEVAAYFPESLWHQLLTESEDIKVIRYTIYKNMNFFKDKNATADVPENVVLTISVPEYKGDLPEDVPFILRHNLVQTSRMSKCGFWDYKHWSTTGISVDINSKNNLLLCRTSHLTPFAVLVGVPTRAIKVANYVVLTVMDESVLDVVSIVGCGLSLFGLVCIWITAICFSQWRSQSSTKLLLNICFVLTLLMTYFLVINVAELRNLVVDMNVIWQCVGVGAFLHYIVLVLFMWMLFEAILQYDKYVRITGLVGSNLRRYAMVAWGLPILPVSLILWQQPMAYVPGDGKSGKVTPVCYINGAPMYYGLVLPMAVIVVTNISLFVFTLWKLHRSLSKHDHNRNIQMYIKELHLSIMMFFLLGISWVFGILAHIDDSMIFSFLFCLTSTLQGFMLFIYFVLLDRGTMKTWIKCCGRTRTYYVDSTTLVRLTNDSTRR